MSNKTIFENNFMRKLLTMSALLSIVIATIQHFDLLFYNYDNLLLYKDMVSGFYQPRQNASPYINGLAAFEREEYDLAESWFINSQNPLELIRWKLIEIDNKKGNWRSVISSLDPTNNEDRDMYFKTLVAHLHDFSEKELVDIEKKVLSQGLTIQYSAHLLANEYFGYAIEWAMKTPNYKQSVLANIIIGRGYFYQGEFERAEESFHNAYNQELNNDTAFWYGRVLNKTGKAEKAVDVLETAIELIDEEDISSHLYLELSSAYLINRQCDRANLALEIALQNNGEVVRVDDDLRRSIRTCK